MKKSIGNLVFTYLNLLKIKNKKFEVRRRSLRYDLISIHVVSQIQESSFTIGKKYLT